MSLSGCAINDEVMEALAPALVKIKNVHLGHNPISSQGWQHLENALTNREIKFCPLDGVAKKFENY